MANTVNGVAVATPITDAQREQTGIDADNCYMYPAWGQVLRARISLDGVGGDILIDDPGVTANGLDLSKCRIYPVGLEFCGTNATKVIFKSKVGAATAVQLSSFDMAAKQLFFYPISPEYPFSPTDIGGKLLVNASAAVDILLHYIIALKRYRSGY